jgi:alpha-L-arabinofuranosidase
MLSRNYLPQLVVCTMAGPATFLDANAKRSGDGKTLVVQVVNSGAQAVPARIDLAGFVPGKPLAEVTELSGALEAVNTAEQPNAVVPKRSSWPHGHAQGGVRRVFPPHSFTVIRFE